MLVYNTNEILNIVYFKKKNQNVDTFTKLLKIFVNL